MLLVITVKTMKHFVACWSLVLLLATLSETRNADVRRSLSDSVRLLGVARGFLRKISGSQYVDWILEKLDSVHLYVSAGQTLAEKLDPDLLDWLADKLGARRSSRADGRSTNSDYASSWRYRPAAIPAYIRKKNKPSSYDEEEEDEDYSASSYGGGGHGGYGGGGHGGGGYGGGGYGGGGYAVQILVIAIIINIIKINI